MHASVGFLVTPKCTIESEGKRGLLTEKGRDPGRTTPELGGVCGVARGRWVWTRVRHPLGARAREGRPSSSAGGCDLDVHDAERVWEALAIRKARARRGQRVRRHIVRRRRGSQPR